MCANQGAAPACKQFVNTLSCSKFGFAPTLEFFRSETEINEQLREKCTLCRRRHKFHYADLRFMPMLLVMPLRGGGSLLARSA